MTDYEELHGLSS
jgi:hypothetical protein